MRLFDSTCISSSYSDSDFGSGKTRCPLSLAIICDSSKDYVKCPKCPSLRGRELVSVL